MIYIYILVLILLVHFVESFQLNRSLRVRVTAFGKGRSDDITVDGYNASEIFGQLGFDVLVDRDFHSQNFHHSNYWNL